MASTSGLLATSVISGLHFIFKSSTKSVDISLEENDVNQFHIIFRAKLAGKVLESSRAFEDFCAVSIVLIFSAQRTKSPIPIKLDVYTLDLRKRSRVYGLRTGWFMD
uniref:Uncharacterized protein n=1 Tax=Cucumis melo TaxID=3656 RepID=A0A9I9E7P8_CUCME